MEGVKTTTQRSQTREMQIITGVYLLNGYNNARGDVYTNANGHSF